MHEYMKRIVQAQAKGNLPDLSPADVTHLTVAHDGWCGVYKGGDCNCNPEITFLGTKKVVVIGRGGKKIGGGSRS